MLWWSLPEHAAWALAIALKVQAAEGPQPPEGSATMGRKDIPWASQFSAVRKWERLKHSYARAVAPLLWSASGGDRAWWGDVTAKSNAAGLPFHEGRYTSAGLLWPAFGCPGLGWRRPGASSLGWRPAAEAKTPTRLRAEWWRRVLSPHEGHRAACLPFLSRTPSHAGHQVSSGKTFAKVAF